MGVADTSELKSRPCEKFQADCWFFALLKALKINRVYPKKTNGQAFRSTEVQM